MFSFGNNKDAFLSRGGQLIKLRGVPYDANAKQVVDFFDSGDNPVKVLDETVLFVKRPDGRSTGEAFVRFQHEEDAINAMAKNRESIGSRYIVLFRSTPDEVKKVIKRCVIGRTTVRTRSNSEQMVNNPQVGYALPEPGVPGAVGGFPLPQHVIASGRMKDCIRLRGLPYEAQIEHILEFLGDHAKHIMYHGVHMIINVQGEPTGQAFIQMDNESNAHLAAQTKHHRCMRFFSNPCFIDVFQCSGDDMNQLLTEGEPNPNV